MAATTLLNLLADGEFCSGQSLADALGVSRTAVWKQVNKIAADLGLDIETVRGRGYRIVGGIDLLNKAAVRAQLAAPARSLMSELVIHEAVDSTNSDALRRARLGAVPGLVCTAEQQTAGRGRRGREWVSPFASNIYLSVLWQYEQGAAALEGLSLAVGVAVARALEALSVPDVRLKWPNDVLHNGAKLGGILLEMEGDAAGPCKVVVGIGLNVAMSRKLALGIDQAWTDIASIVGDAAPARSHVLAALLNELLPLLSAFEARGFAGYRSHWQGLDAYGGQTVVLDTGSRQMAGIARGVDERGALLLETSSGVQTIYGGEISLRPGT